jgi:hypothetical protein
MPDDVLFDVPADLPADLEAVRILNGALEQLRAAVADLAGQHADLARRVDGGRGRGADAGAVPGVLRWAGMDSDTAAKVWAWLIDWVGWAVEHYELQEEIPACWAQHWPLVEELTGLCAAWHVATDGEAAADALLRWHESLHRARPRLREWDDHTKCRNGQHGTYHADLAWPPDWRQHAIDRAQADAASRPAADTGPQTNPDPEPAPGHDPAGPTRDGGETP